jgi:hypothetical protein
MSGFRQYINRASKHERALAAAERSAIKAARRAAREAEKADRLARGETGAPVDWSLAPRQAPAEPRTAPEAAEAIPTQHLSRPLTRPCGAAWPRSEHAMAAIPIALQKFETLARCALLARRLSAGGDRLGPDFRYWASELTEEALAALRTLPEEELRGEWQDWH